MKQDSTEHCGFGVIPEAGGFRFLVYAENIDRITLTLNNIEYPMEKAPVRLHTYTLFFEKLTPPFHYVYNIFKGKNFFCDLLDPFCPFTDPTGTKSVYKVEEPFSFDSSHPHHCPDKLVIYELCVRSFTNDPSSKVKHPGTLEGLIEKLDYLEWLGVNAIELLPVTLFHPPQLWGYMPRHFMALAPHLSYDKKPDISLKKLVDAAHKKGIEVYLDLVFNHTDSMEYVLFPFCENFYLKNYDATGCGNTLNVNHPIVTTLLLQAVKRFVEVYNIDGIRFDLGLALCRDENGEILSNPPFIHQFENLYKKKIKIFYEPWDTAGYRLDDFPSKNGFVWDDLIRDTIRRFARMDDGQLPLLFERFHSPNAVKMVSCHDGFTLFDLVSYEQKHNLINGYKNRDGHTGNFSSNCGYEGETTDEEILSRRIRRAETIFTMLFCFSGPILINAGDEFLSTHYGNNNPFNQDNRISYIEWNRQIYPSFKDFTKKLIDIYKNSPLSNPHALVQFHGQNPYQLGLQHNDHLFAITKTDEKCSIFIAANSWKDPIEISLPVLENGEWDILISTAKNPLVLEHNTVLIAKTVF
jgi:glycogen operon protein